MLWRCNTESFPATAMHVSSIFWWNMIQFYRQQCIFSSIYSIKSNLSAILSFHRLLSLLIILLTVPTMEPKVPCRCNLHGLLSTKSHSIDSQSSPNWVENFHSIFSNWCFIWPKVMLQQSLIWSWWRNSLGHLQSWVSLMCDTCISLIHGVTALLSEIV